MYNSLLQLYEFGIKKLQEIIRNFIEQRKEDIGEFVMSLETINISCSLTAFYN